MMSLASIGAVAALFLVGCSTGDESASSSEDVDSAETTVEAAESEGIEEDSDAQAEGTRENPLPLGSAVEGDEWIVTINSVDLEASDAVVSANMLNEPAPDGLIYILVNATVQYTGDDPDGMSAMMTTIEYVTVDGNTIATHDDATMMTVAPDPLDTMQTLYNGASTTGNIVLAVPADSAGDGALGVSAGMFESKVFVAVQ